MTIDILNETNYDISGYTDIFRRVVLTTLYHENFNYDGEVSIIIVDNERIRQLNRKFRKIDKETDVLSFPCYDLTTDLHTDMPIELGDIVISFDKAVEQSKEYGHTIERELSFLICHSVLHLLGYDHKDDLKSDEMFKKQKLILEKAGIPR